MSQRPAVLRIPKVSVQTLYRHLRDGIASTRYDWVWTATATGWATESHFLVKLPDWAVRQWKAIPDPQCHPAYGTPCEKKRLVPYQEVLEKAQKKKYGKAAEVLPLLGWDDNLLTVTVTLSDGKQKATLDADYYAILAWLYPEGSWHLPRPATKNWLNHPAALRHEGELVGILVPISVPR